MAEIIFNHYDSPKTPNTGSTGIYFGTDGEFKKIDYEGNKTLAGPPRGGSDGQVLTKSGSTNYDYYWSTNASDNYWSLNGSILEPVNSTYDLLISGGTLGLTHGTTINEISNNSAVTANSRSILTENAIKDYVEDQIGAENFWDRNSTILSMVNTGDTLQVGDTIINGSVLAQGTVGATPISGAGTRMMWIPSKAAFRCGIVDGIQWDAANIGHYSFAAGYNNTANGLYSTVGGGGNNTASDSYSTVGGGGNNTASGFYSTVGGGGDNTANSLYSTVGGGYNNTASEEYSTVGGGRDNTASGYYSTVGGGRNNTASQGYTFASGLRAKAIYSGCFVWADSTDADFTSTAVNQFLIRASGGVGINTNLTGATLTIKGEGTTSATTALEIYNNTGTSVLSIFDNGSIQTADPSSGIGKWKLGDTVSETGMTLISTDYIEVDINGTIYKLALVEHTE